jgi:hypothetical protein
MQKPVRIPRTIPSTALAPSEQISCMITSVAERELHGSWKTFLSRAGNPGVWRAAIP